MSQTDPAESPQDMAETPAEQPADQKSAFKAALERKNAAAHARSQHLEGDNKVTGSSHAAATKRTFRRKSG